MCCFTLQQSVYITIQWVTNWKSIMAHTCLFKIKFTDEVFSNSGLNYNCCLLTVGINTVAVFKNSEQSFKIFDSHWKDFYGTPHSFGKCTFLSIEGLENLVSYLQMSCSEVEVVPFEIKGVLISDSQFDLESVQKNEESLSSDKNNPKHLVNRKRKCSGETADIREKRLITRCEYERKRKANESEVFLAFCRASMRIFLYFGDLRTIRWV